MLVSPLSAAVNRAVNRAATPTTSNQTPNFPTRPHNLDVGLDDWSIVQSDKPSSRLINSKQLPDMASTRIPVVITYHKPGTQPPLFVAGTFSDPQWQPHEMEHTVREDGEYNFKKEVHAEPGTKIKYKFRLGDRDWVLQDDGSTVTDSDGNTNNVLEVTAPQIAAKHLRPMPDAAAADRSVTPIFARVAAEVADSAALLHEEVPERESPKSQRVFEPLDETGQVGAVSFIHSLFSNLTRQNAILILEPPPGLGGPFTIQSRGDDFLDDQDGYIADKSPLFAHECPGLYESDGEVDQAESDGSLHVDHVRDFDDGPIDLNDPTLERFPSSREDIIDAVRKLETGLEADEASFDGAPRSPVVNTARRGSEDITGDFWLAPHGASLSPTQQRKSPRGSISSIPPASLHAISESEELPEEQVNFRPAVVFSNPLNRRPQDLKQLPASDEDEGIALVSPKTVKTAHLANFPTPSPNQPIPSAAEPQPPAINRPSYAQVAATPPPPTNDDGDDTPTPSHQTEPSASTTITATGHVPPHTAQLKKRRSGASTSLSEQQDQDQDQDQNQEQEQEQQQQPEQEQAQEQRTRSIQTTSRAASIVNVGAMVQPKPGGGWIRAVVRVVFVTLIGGAVKRVLRSVRRILRFVGIARREEQQREGVRAE